MKRVASALLLLGVATQLCGLHAFADGLIELRPYRDADTANTYNNSSTYQPYTSNDALYSSSSTRPTAAASSQALYDTSASSPTTLQARVSSIPAGQSMVLRLNQDAGSDTAQVGQTVSATLEAPLYANNVEVIPAGSEVLGQVTFVSPSGRLGKHGEVELSFHQIITPSGQTVSMDADVVTTNGTPVLKGNTYKTDIARGVAIAGGGTALGALGGLAVGGIVDAAGTGAAIGTAIGGAAGLGYAAWRKGKPVILPNGTRLNVKLMHPIVLGVDNARTYR